MGRPDSILGQFGKQVGGSKVKLFAITGHSSESVAFARWQQRTGINKSVAFVRGRGLLCSAPQLVTYLLQFVYYTDVTSGEVREAEYSKQ